MAVLSGRLRRSLIRRTIGIARPISRSTVSAMNASVRGRAALSDRAFDLIEDACRPPNAEELAFDTVRQIVSREAQEDSSGLLSPYLPRWTCSQAKPNAGIACLETSIKHSLPVATESNRWHALIEEMPGHGVLRGMARSVLGQPDPPGASAKCGASGAAPDQPARASDPQMLDVTQSLRRLRGSAPTWVAAGLPSLNKISVGMPRTP